MVNISVIIPTYNHARYVGEAIQSALDQTYDKHEIIVVDDGSTDDTSQVVARFSNRVHYIRQQNQGLSGARNTGVRHANGEFIALLDADDLWAPNFLAASVATIQKNQRVGLTHSWWGCIDEKGKELPEPGTDSHRGDLFDTLVLSNRFPPVSTLFRKCCIEEAGYFDENLTALEDWDLWLRIAANGWLFDYVPQVLAQYRRHGSNMTLDVSRMERNQLKVLSKLEASAFASKLTGRITRSRANVYLNSALSYHLQMNPQTSYQSFRKAILVWPEILTQEETWYRWICADQPPGYQNTSYFKDLDVATKRIHGLMSQLSADPEISVKVKEPSRDIERVIGIVLAKHYYKENNNKMARQQLLAQLPRNPGMLSEPQITWLLVKTFLGQERISSLRKLFRVPRISSD